jgi:acyl carrier protein
VPAKEQAVTQPLAEIAAIIRTVLRDPSIEVTPAKRFEDLTGWDSMDLVAVVVEVECRLNLQFEVYEIDRLITVADLVDMIAVKQALAAA